MTNFDETRLFDSNFYDKNDIHNILKNVVATRSTRSAPIVVSLSSCRMIH